jgi:hypothetical protein
MSHETLKAPTHTDSQPYIEELIDNHGNNTGEQSEVAPTPPAEYLYGGNLTTQQRMNLRAETLKYQGRTDVPWVKGDNVAYGLRIINHDTALMRESGDFTDEQILQKLKTSYGAGFVESVIRGNEHIRLQLRAYGDTHADVTDDELVAWIDERKAQFFEEAEKYKGDFEVTKQEFIETMKHAIHEQGLPITEEQMMHRLKNVSFGYFDPYEYPQNLGSYDVNEDRILVDIRIAGDEFKRVVFHELLHALSGGRYIVNDATFEKIEPRQIGFQQSNRRRTWLNEAVTDLLAYTLVNHTMRHNFDFGSTTMPLGGAKSLAAWDVLEDIPEQKRGTYHQYKETALRVMQKVPTRTLLRAYFAQNNDKFEADKMAGTHAERDLQRAIKAAGGKDRVRDLRTIDRLYREGAMSAPEIIAKTIEEEDDEDVSFDLRHPVKFLSEYKEAQANRKLVEQNTRQRKAMIKAAKLAVKRTGRKVA